MVQWQLGSLTPRRVRVDGLVKIVDVLFHFLYVNDIYATIQKFDVMIFEIVFMRL